MEFYQLRLLSLLMLTPHIHFIPLHTVANCLFYSFQIIGMYFLWIIVFFALARGQQCVRLTESQPWADAFTPRSKVTTPSPWTTTKSTSPAPVTARYETPELLSRELWRQIKKSLNKKPKKPTTNPVSSAVQSVLDIPPPRDDNEEQHVLLLVAILLLAVLQLIFAVLTMPMIIHFYSRRVNIGGNCGRKKEEHLV